MRLYNFEAERLLREKVLAIREEHARWRCIRLDFSSQHDRYNERLISHVVMNIVKGLFDEGDGHIYLCDDGEVFILFQGKASDIVARLAGQYSDLNYELYDLGLHWERFHALCQAKVETAQAGIFDAVETTVMKPLRELDAVRFRSAQQKRIKRERMQVLVVEDDPFTRRLVNGTLKGAYDIIEAGDGEAALSAYETYAPDAVFLDIELPDTNGHEILGKLLACDRTAFVVMLSANSVKENILVALEKGAQGFATKPFARDKLIHYLSLCETMRRSQVTAIGGAHA